MKTKVILSISILIPFTMLFLYVWTTATDLIIRDDMYLIKGGFIESYLKGTLTFADLWRPTNCMRILGGALIYIADVKWFSMNLKMITLLNPFLILASALLIYREYRKSLIQKFSPEFIAASYFMITLIIFHIIQWEALINSGSIAFQYPMPFIVASFISLELCLLKGKLKYLPAALILPSLAVLVFGGRLIFVFAPTLGIIFLCYLITRRFHLAKDFWHRALMIVIFLSIIGFLYTYRIDYNDYVQSPQYLESEIFEVFVRPVDALKFILASFGASIIGIDAFFACNYISFNIMVAIGFITVTFYAVALILFFTSHMYERTFLPLFLIIQTFLYLGFMTIGRFGIESTGLDYGMASRYTCVSLYGVASIVWIFIFIFAQHQPASILTKGTIIAGFSMIFAGLLLTSIAVWNNQPRQKVFFEQLRDIALRLDTATPDELANFAERPDMVRGSLLLLREHKLNVYRNVPAGRK